MKVLVLIGLLLLPFSAWGPDVALQWDAPTTNADGTPLTDLAGYRVYCSSIQGDYSGVTPIDVGNTTSITFNNLADGTDYCVVTAYDVSGNESGYSNEVVRTVAIPPSAPAVSCSVNIQVCNGCSINCQ